MKVFVEVKNGEVVGVYSDVDGDAVVLNDVDATTMSDIEYKELEKTAKSVPYSLLKNAVNDAGSREEATEMDAATDVLEGAHVGDFYAVEYHDGGTEKEIIGRITDISKNAVTIDHSRGMLAMVDTILAKDIVSTRNVSYMKNKWVFDSEGAPLFAESSLGTIVVSHTGYGEEYPGVYIDLLPNGKEDVPLPLLIAETVENEKDENGKASPIVAVRSYISEEKDGVDEDGETYKGKVSNNAPINVVRLSKKDIDDFLDIYDDKAKDYTVVCTAHGRYEFTVRARSADEAMEKVERKHPNIDFGDLEEVVGSYGIKAADDERVDANDVEPDARTNQDGGGQPADEER